MLYESELKVTILDCFQWTGVYLGPQGPIRANVYNLRLSHKGAHTHTTLNCNLYVKYTSFSLHQPNPLY
jgi:hypothetical protein